MIGSPEARVPDAKKRLVSYSSRLLSLRHLRLELGIRRLYFKLTSFSPISFELPPFKLNVFEIYVCKLTSFKLRPVKLTSLAREFITRPKEID